MEQVTRPAIPNGFPQYKQWLRNWETGTTTFKYGKAQHVKGMIANGTQELSTQSDREHDINLVMHGKMPLSTPQ